MLSCQGVIPSSSWRLRVGVPLWILSLLGVVASVERPSPLFLNLGAGDSPFARGFRDRWERDGLNQTGETMFRWTLDGSRLEFPLDVRGGRLLARIRLARFVDTPAGVTFLAGGRAVDEWTQAPHGWSVRDMDMGELRGPLTLQFRSKGEDLGVALDWVEVRGATRVLPMPRVLWGLGALLLGVPLLVGLLLRDVPAALATGIGLSSAVCAGLLLDRFGGLMAAASAGPPALAVTALLGLGSHALGRLWPEHLAGRLPLAVPLAASLLCLLALSHPFYYYPDVDTHAQYLAQIRAHPDLLWDSREYQLRTGNWTREIGGHRVAFPYSPAFHVAAWPFALALGEVPAVKALAVLALSLSLLLVYALSRALGLGSLLGVLAQALLLLLPVTSSRLTLALFPALLGQALELLLVVHLVRRFPHLDGGRDAAAAFLFLFLAQLSYTGSLLNVGALIAAFSLLEFLFGDRRRLLRLLGAYMASALLVLALLYLRFLPTFLHEVLPHAQEAREKESGSLAGLVFSRLAFFYDVVYPLLLLPGLLAIRAAPGHARRLVFALLLAGSGFLVLRFLAPAVFRDTKEVELLAGAVAVVSAAALDLMARKGPWGRLLSVGLGLVAFAWGITRAIEAYAERFVAVGL
jgi:hypothetical protein